jgi:hypothetical protein
MVVDAGVHARGPMGRPERVIDPDAGPIAAFCHQLRLLRERAGRPTYRHLEKLTHYSASVLSRAASGERLPSREVTLAFVAACGGDTAEWDRRWAAAAHDAPEPALPALLDLSGNDSAVSAGLDRVRPRRWLSRRLVLAVATALLIAVATTVVLLLRQRTVPDTWAADGADPYAAGCSRDKRGLDWAAITRPDGKPFGSLILWYSSACQAAWGYVTGPNSTKWTAHIIAHRPADGASAPSEFSADTDEPGSWGNVLSARNSCVWIEAFVSDAQGEGKHASTSCFQPGGVVNTR